MSFELAASEILSLRSIEIRLCLSSSFVVDVYILRSFDSVSSSLVIAFSSSVVISSLVECLQTSCHDLSSSDHRFFLSSLVALVDSSTLRHFQRTRSHALHSDSQFPHLGLRLRQWLVESFDLFDSHAELPRLSGTIFFLSLETTTKSSEAHRSHYPFFSHCCFLLLLLFFFAKKRDISIPPLLSDLLSFGEINVRLSFSPLIDNQG